MPVAEFADIVLQTMLSVFPPSECDPCANLDLNAPVRRCAQNTRKCSRNSMRSRLIGYLSASLLLVLLLWYKSSSLFTITPSPSTGTSASTNSNKNQRIPVDNEGFAGCIVVKDDNDRISEWIGYHYLTLPLKHLIVAVDPTAKTTPREIVQMWNTTEEIDMEVLLWDDADYGHWINEDLDDLHRHRDRQKRFLAECQKYHKRKGRSWVALVDPDEFITFNLVEADDRDPERSNDVDVFDLMNGKNFTALDYRIKMQELRQQMTDQNVLQHQTVMDYLNQHKNEEPWKSESCYLMLRTLFSAIESPPDVLEDAGVTKYGLDANKFTTLKYYKHGEKGSWYDNHFGKVLVDVSRIDESEISRDMANIHTPLDRCYYPWRLYETGILNVNHYLGSWEQYSARVDVRRDRAKFDVSAFVNFGIDFQMQGWLKRFVTKVGAEKSRMLFQHSGIIDVGKEDDPMLMDRPDYKYVVVNPPSWAHLENNEVGVQQVQVQQAEKKEEEDGAAADPADETLLYYYDNGKLTGVKDEQTGESIPLDDPRLKVNSGQEKA